MLSCYLFLSLFLSQRQRMVIKKLASIPLEAAAKVSKRIRDPPGLFYSAEEKGE